jgi:hypothetical protein
VRQAQLQRLMAGRVARQQQQFHAAIAEDVRVAIDEADRCIPVGADRRQ